MRAVRKPKCKPKLGQQHQVEKLAIPPGWPLLEDLSGYGKAKTWGLSLGRDLQDYLAGTISWAAMDRGCVLSGPPGVGKTTFAKALARSCNVPLIVASYSNWQRYRDGHLGNVISAIHNDFRRAMQCAPCILFIDEIDVIPSREHKSIRVRDWWDPIVGALLQELDGIASREGVIVIAACNYPDRIDPALVRAGRLDARIEIGLPGMDDLAGIFRTHLGEDLPDADLRPVAVSATGLTGADVEKVVRDARRTARFDKRRLKLQDLLATLEAEAPRIPDDCLTRIAVHEVGHAVTAILLGTSGNVTISLVRRGRLVAETNCETRNVTITRKVLEGKIAVALAGRAAEKVICGEVSAGAGGSSTCDLALATAMALHAIACCGMSISGSLLYACDEAPEQIFSWRPDLIDEVQGMLEAAHQRATAIIEANKAAVRAIAAALIERRALTHEQIVALLPSPSGGGSGPTPRRPRNKP